MDASVSGRQCEWQASSASRPLRSSTGLSPLAHTQASSRGLLPLLGRGFVRHLGSVAAARTREVLHFPGSQRRVPGVPLVLTWCGRGSRRRGSAAVERLIPRPGQPPLDSAVVHSQRGAVTCGGPWELAGFLSGEAQERGLWGRMWLASFPRVVGERRAHRWGGQWAAARTRVLRPEQAGQAEGTQEHQGHSQEQVA